MEKGFGELANNDSDINFLYYFFVFFAISGVISVFPYTVVFCMKYTKIK